MTVSEVESSPGLLSPDSLSLRGNHPKDQDELNKLLNMSCCFSLVLQIIVSVCFCSCGPAWRWPQRCEWEDSDDTDRLAGPALMIQRVEKEIMSQTTSLESCIDHRPSDTNSHNCHQPHLFVFFCIVSITNRSVSRSLSLCFVCSSDRLMDDAIR